MRPPISEYLGAPHCFVPGHADCDSSEGRKEMGDWTREVRHWYWFEEVPVHVSDNKTLKSYLGSRRGLKKKMSYFPARLPKGIDIRPGEKLRYIERIDRGGFINTQHGESWQVSETCCEIVQTFGRRMPRSETLGFADAMLNTGSIA